jgi:hypothetical protein
MVERQLPKLHTRVRFPSPAPFAPTRRVVSAVHPVRSSSAATPDDAERAAWLAQPERRLRGIWDNDADAVFNELLTR